MDLLLGQQTSPSDRGHLSPSCAQPPPGSQIRPRPLRPGSSPSPASWYAGWYRGCGRPRRSSSQRQRPNLAPAQMWIALGSAHGSRPARWPGGQHRGRSAGRTSEVPFLQHLRSGHLLNRSRLERCLQGRSANRPGAFHPSIAPPHLGAYPRHTSISSQWKPERQKKKPRKRTPHPILGR